MFAASLTYNVKDGFVEASGQNYLPQVSGTTPAAGPGNISGKLLPQALRFSGNDHVSLFADGFPFNNEQFTVQVIFKVDTPVTDRANVFEAFIPACSVHILPSVDPASAFMLVATVDNAQTSWRGTDTTLANFKLGQWYTVELAYERDTLGLFVNGVQWGSSVFERGDLRAVTPNLILVGAHPSLSRWFFKGDIAYLEINSGLPNETMAAIDTLRRSPNWHMGLKETKLLNNFGLGAKIGSFDFQGVSSFQRYLNGTIFHSSVSNAAFLLQGPIRDRYDALTNKHDLGALLSDETVVKRNGALKSSFEFGAIWWSASTGAWEVMGLIYAEYLRLGSSVSPLGLPVGPVQNVPGGQVQPYEFGELYWKSGSPRAISVTGPIRIKYNATGGVQRWGFPISDETEVMRTELRGFSLTPIGKKQSFENATFYWSSATGAHDVGGEILKEYEASGGAGLPFDDESNGLGFPTSDEKNFPAWAGLGKISVFEHGVIVWKDNKTRIVLPFKLHLGLVETEEDEGPGLGRNDLFFHIQIKKNGVEVFNKREPNEDQFDGNNSRDLNLTLDPEFQITDPFTTIELRVEVWEYDTGAGGDDNILGTLSKEFEISSGWGFLDSATGIFNISQFDKVKSFAFQMRPRWSKNAEKDWWNVVNKGTPLITYQQFGDAFVDIDDDPESTGIADAVQEKYFHKVIEKAAVFGNCFGFAREMLFAWHGGGFGMPLKRVKEADWLAVQNRMNISQISYFGATGLGYVRNLVERKITPSQVFNETRALFDVGDYSIVNMWQNTNYTGLAHSVVPNKWDDSNPTSWIMTVVDPNTVYDLPPVSQRTQTITINPQLETFTFSGSSFLSAPVNGSMHFVPWSATGFRQQSVVKDPMLLFYALTVVILLGSAAKTSAVTDSRGDNLWLDKNKFDPADLRARERLHLDVTGTGQFLSVTPPEFDMNGEILIRRSLPRSHGERAEPPEVDGQSIELGPDFSHEIVGAKDGQFDCIILHGLSSTRFSGSIKAGEKVRLTTKDLDSGNPRFRFNSTLNRQISIEHTIRAGLSPDFRRLSLPIVESVSGKGVELCPSSGLSTVDVLMNGVSNALPIELVQWRGTSPPEIRSFEGEMKDGIRLALPSSGAANILAASRIDSAFGSVRNSSVWKQN